MKTRHPKKTATFGEFIKSVYEAYGPRRASEIVWFAVTAGLVQFQGAQRLVFAESSLN